MTDEIAALLDELERCVQVWDDWALEPEEETAIADANLAIGRIRNVLERCRGKAAA